MRTIAAGRDLGITVIVGPTGIGKTKLGVSLALALTADVISVDSLQCYNMAPILTAQPTREETQGVKHHLINFLKHDAEPANYPEDVLESVKATHSRGRKAVLVGGSTSLLCPTIRLLCKHGYRLRVIALTVDSKTSIYHQVIEERIETMVRMGLLSEIGLLYKSDASERSLSTGVRKAIGYSELLPCITTPCTETERDFILKDGLARMKDNTIAYAALQLKFVQEHLMPLLVEESIPAITLPVLSDQDNWDHIESLAQHFASQGPLLSIPRCDSPNNASEPVVCVFAGSSPGSSPAHVAAADTLANEMHRRGVRLVYGGGTTGIMGALASRLVRLAGPHAVHGFIPSALVAYESKHGSTYDPALHGRRTVVRNMHARKRAMVDAVLAAPWGGFLSLSGGLGTAEELLEMATWRQLGLHGRDVCVWDIEGLYKGLKEWIWEMQKSGFVEKQDGEILRFASEAGEALDGMKERAGMMRVLDWD